MRGGRRWRNKPPIGTQIDGYHPFAKNLGVFYPLNEGVGYTANDIMGGAPLIGTGFGGANPWSSVGDVGIKFNAANTLFTTVNLPSTQYKIVYPITLIVGLRVLGNAPAANNALFGYQLSSNASPTFGYLLINTQVKAFGSTSGNSVTGPILSPGNHVIAAEITSRTISLYVDGILYGPTYVTQTPTNNLNLSLLGFGTAGNFGRYTNTIAYWGGVWYGILPATIHAEIGSGGNVSSIWQMFKPRFDRRILYTQGIAPIVIFTGANFNCSGDMVENNAYITGRNIQFSASVDFKENNGKISQVSEIFACAGDLSLLNTKITNCTINLLGQGDLFNNAIKNSGITTSYVGYGDVQINVGAKFGDNLLFSSSSDLSESGVKNSNFIVSFNSSGDFVVVDVAAFALYFNLDSSGDITENDGTITATLIPFNGSGDLLATNIRGTIENISISCSSDILVDGVKLTPPLPLIFNGSGDFTLNCARGVVESIDFKNAGDLLVNLGKNTQLPIGTTFNCSGDITVGSAKIDGVQIIFNGDGDFTVIPSQVYQPTYILNILLRVQSININLQG